MRQAASPSFARLPRAPFLVTLLILLTVFPAAAAVNVDVRSPRDGSSFTHRLNLAYVTGDTWMNMPFRRPMDVVFLIDTSGSTSDPSGADVDGDGRRGRGIVLLSNTDRGDSILAAEVASARKLLHSLDPSRVAVALVTFDGARTTGWGIRGQLVPDAIVEQTLTQNFALVDQGLDRIMARGPDGGTNMAEGMRVAINELSGFQSESRPRPGAERAIYFFTDGFPTLPFIGWFAAERKNVELTVYYAETAGRLGIKVHAFAVGKEALSRPLATVDAARVSGGTFIPVADPGNLPAVVDAVAAARVDRVTVRNTTTGDPARVVQLNPDGTFDSLVPVRAGRNLLEVVANATDGSVARRNVSVNYQPATEKILDVSVEEAKNLDKLLNIQVQEDKTPRPNNELFIEIEVERQKALERAEQQRGELGMGRGSIKNPPTPPAAGTPR